MRHLVIVLASLLGIAAPGCRPTAIAPPYAAGEAPRAADLLTTVVPKLDALQVPAAKVRVGRAPAGNLMFLAQKPGRFSGQIQVAGHEFISLAFHERGYTLRNVAADNLPSGFFQGPPADCAIQRLLGVPFAADELVSLVLGGAPVIHPPHQVVEQRWDPRLGHEVVRLRNVEYEQELRFAFVAGAWWPAGGTLWRKQPDGTLARMWSLLHEDLRSVGGTILPQRTRIVGASERKQDRVLITYNEQLIDTDLGEEESGGQADAGEAGDEGGGWEGDEEGAEAAPAPAEAAKVPAAPARVQIPPQFTLDSAGLTPRGDLCR